MKDHEDYLLTGGTGCGKTHLASAAMRHYIQNARNDVDSPWGSFSAMFVTVVELLLEIRQTYHKNSELSERDIIDRYSMIHLLVLDDLGAKKNTEWTEQTLYLIIDRRINNKMWTIVTSNLSLDEIERAYGARIASRLAEMKVVEIDLPDYRKRRPAGDKK